MSLTAKYARGAYAYGICQRCGQRALLNELVMDGYYPLLRVHPECYDAKHPQERLPKVSDPQVLWRPSPEQAHLPPVLAGTQNGGTISFTWTAANTYGDPRIESYAVYRSAGASAAGLIASLPVVYSDTFAATVSTLAYSDSSISSGVAYAYYVAALDSYGRQLASNTLSFSAVFPSAVVLAVSLGGTEIDLSWTASTVSGATIANYLVYRSVNGAAYSLLATVSGSLLVYPDIGLTVGSSYSYYVVARDSNNAISSNSNVVSATPTIQGVLVLQPVTPTVAATSPLVLVVHPNSGFVYAGDYNGSRILQYSVNADGTLSPLSPAFVTSAPQIVAMYITRAGSFLYANGSDNKTYQHSIGVDGKLTALSPATFATGGNPHGIAVTPDERFFYSCQTGPTNTGTQIAQCALAPGGQLSSLSPSTVATGSGPSEILITPNGLFVYVTSQFNSYVYQYSVNQTTGVLTSLSPSFFNIPSGTSAGFVMDRTGTYLYVSSSSGNVYQYSIGVGGALTFVRTLVAIQVQFKSPLANVFYGVTASPNLVFNYRAISDGSFVALSPATTAIPFSPNFLAATPDGRFAYIAHFNAANAISQYTVV